MTNNFLQILSFLVIWLLSSFQGYPQAPTEGEFWKLQVEEEVMGPWTRYGIDEEQGAYYSHLNQSWETFGGNSKFPGMIARHLYSYAAAYLLHGNMDYLNQADRSYTYLIDKGWDQKFGGWYYELDRTGKVINDDKELFMNTYAITGLAMYYLVTRDPEVKSYIDRSIDILEDHAWDKEHGGYVKRLNRDLTIKDPGKEFSPQLAPLSGYLLYLYCATREEKYLEMSERIMEVVLTRMYDEESGWILESFNRDWTPIAGKNEWMNTGHNIEVAWMLLRMYEFNGKERYREFALELNEKLLAYAYNRERGFWYRQVNVKDPRLHSEEGSWWIQAYGNMFQLFLYHVTGLPHYYGNFLRGAEFWNEHFMDRTRGGAFIAIDENGEILNGRKAVKTKTSYHSVEHGLLNYIYLDLWHNNEGIELYYYLSNTVGDEWYPLPVEDKIYEIEQLRINDRQWGNIDQEKGSVSLPVGSRLPLVIRVRDR